jgi:hypothetical protein
MQEIDPYSWPRKLRRELTLPRQGGVYALFLRKGSTIPIVEPLADGLIYIGLGKSLAKRCHFKGRSEGHSPRRSLGAILASELGLEPRMGANGNYRFDPDGERKLDNWMHGNLLMSFAEFEDVSSVEDALIAKYAPPLNLNKCTQTEKHRLLKEMRAAMLEVARRQQ